MTPEAEEFLSNIIKESIISINEKYRKGAKKYKNDLLNLSLEELVRHAILENIDQYTYLKAIERKLNDKHRQRTTK